MTSKEIVKRIITHDAPPRFGFEFHDFSDIRWIASRRYINLPDNPYAEWGDYPELKELTGFHGETYRDIYGNIHGRFNGKTLGECIRGVIRDWDTDVLTIPEFDPAYREELLTQALEKDKKFVLAAGSSLFSQLRNARMMDNALMDTITDPDRVAEFLDRLAEHEAAVIRSIAGCGVDGWILSDDLGTQNTTFISPASFRALFIPAYKKIIAAAHEAGMSVFMHSCGHNYGFLEDLIGAGIDVFQFDQPDTYPTEVLAKEFARRVTFYSPVDIQKILPTGDRELIERRAKEMCELFRAAGGGWIAKDYPTYNDIGVDPAWAKWAEDVIVANSAL